MSRNGPTSSREVLESSEKTPISKALTEVFGSESMKLLAMHSFPKFNSEAEGVMANAVQKYYKVGIAANDNSYTTPLTDDKYWIEEAA